MERKDLNKVIDEFKDVTDKYMMLKSTPVGDNEYFTLRNMSTLSSRKIELRLNKWFYDFCLNKLKEEHIKLNEIIRENNNLLSFNEIEQLMCYEID